MKRSDQDRLLREIFSDLPIEQVREASLAGGVAVLRARRRRRSILAGTSAALLVVLLSLALFELRVPAPSLSQPAAAKLPEIKRITDEQLLALFADRGVALVGPPGEQRIVFLDRAQPIAAVAIKR